MWEKKKAKIFLFTHKILEMEKYSHCLVIEVQAASWDLSHDWDSQGDGHCTHPKQSLLQGLWFTVTSGRMSACSMLTLYRAHVHTAQCFLLPNNTGPVDCLLGTVPGPSSCPNLNCAHIMLGRELAGLIQNHARGHATNSARWVTVVGLCSDTISLTSLDIAEKYSSSSRKTTAQELANKQRNKNISF